MQLFHLCFVLNLSIVATNETSFYSYEILTKPLNVEVLLYDKPLFSKCCKSQCIIMIMKIATILKLSINIAAYLETDVLSRDYNLHA